jgi:hypothetical protein
MKEAHVRRQAENKNTFFQLISLGKLLFLLSQGVSIAKAKKVVESTHMPKSGRGCW